MATLVFVCAIAGCGSSARSPSSSAEPNFGSPAPSGTLPLRGASAAQERFGQLLDRRCRQSHSTLAAIAKPRTLAEQASDSAAQERVFERLLAATAAPPPPRSASPYLHRFRQALASAAQDDGYVADASKKGDAEGVASWLGRLAGARRDLDAAAPPLLALSCRL